MKMFRATILTAAMAMLTIAGANAAPKRMPLRRKPIMR